MQQQQTLNTSEIDDFLKAFEEPPASKQQLPPVPKNLVQQQVQTVSPPQREQPSRPTPVNDNDDDDYEPAPIKQERLSSQKSSTLKKKRDTDDDYDHEEVSFDKRPIDVKKKIPGIHYLKIVHTATVGSTRQVAVIEENDPNESQIYRAIIHLDPLKIKIDDCNDQRVIEIKQKLLAIHPTFQVKCDGNKFGNCTQRFKVNSKKFNYQREDNKEILKMVGEYGYHFAIKKEEKIVAKVIDKKSQVDLEIDSEDDIVHIVIMCMIMLQQRFLGVMGKQMEFGN